MSLESWNHSILSALFSAVATKGSFNVCGVTQEIFSDVINRACHFCTEQKLYKHETKHKQLIFACYELQMSRVRPTTSPALSTNSAHVRLISYCRRSKAFSSYILDLNIPRVHYRPMLCIAESSLRSRIKPVCM